LSEEQKRPLRPLGFLVVAELVEYPSPMPELYPTISVKAKNTVDSAYSVGSIRF
jgi:hypothetical protein